MPLTKSHEGHAMKYTIHIKTSHSDIFFKIPANQVFYEWGSITVLRAYNFILRPFEMVIQITRQCCETKVIRMKQNK